MRNFVQPGVSVTVTAPAGGVVSGAVVVIGSMFGIAATTAAAGREVELRIGGVFELAKVSTEVWTVGQPIFVTGAGVATTVSSGNTRIGVAAAPAANPSAIGTVRLNDSF